ncbi:MAG TPA: transglycosylase SLT domain-containing protein, partial [Rhizomicrobium sp.]|nr:transglycosylase SLT domain-containing protein [Rhizomicrobium sp.]
MQIGAITDPVVSALKQAAAATGSDFHYLLGTAMRESSLRPMAQSGTSSAAGLFQFVDQTWLGLVKTHGAQYGLSAMADAISVGSDGRYRTANDS